MSLTGSSSSPACIGTRTTSERRRDGCGALQATNRLPEAAALSRRHLAILLDFTRRTGHAHPHLDAALANYKAILEHRGRNSAEIEADMRALQGQGAEPEANRNSASS